MSKNVPKTKELYWFCLSLSLARVNLHNAIPQPCQKSDHREIRPMALSLMLWSSGDGLLESVQSGEVGGPFFWPDLPPADRSCHRKWILRFSGVEMPFVYIQ